MKKTPSQRTGRHGQIQTLTKQQLNLLTPADLKRLTDFAERRMDWLPRARISAQDVVQKALHSIIRGTNKGAEGRRPPLEKLQTKEAFLHYVRSAINSVVEAMKRKRELSFDHETIDRDQDTEHEPRVIVLTTLPNPDEDASMVDLKNELFARLRKVAPARLLPTIDEWEKTFFWAYQVPLQKKRRHQLQVRHLAMRILQQIAKDLSR